MVQYRKLELNVLREIADSNGNGVIAEINFDTYLENINSLLENIEIRADSPTTTFKIYDRGSGSEIPARDISSGESELVSLAIECLAFSRELVEGKQNLLCLDEPDVHLHPDLQGRLMRFLDKLVAEHGFTIVLATHSTPILGELAASERTAVAFMKAGDKELEFHQIDDIYRKILPVFGAHPLSNVFNSAPILLVEGEDDVRIWQQAVRSSEGSIKIYPVECESVTELGRYEYRTKSILDSVYDNATAYSLRDGDGVTEELNDEPPIVRMRLSCRAAENLLLSDEVLESVNKTWEDVVSSIEAWLTKNPDHSRHSVMREFKDGGYQRKDFDIKELRMLLVGTILDSNKPWEVLVGQTLGTLNSDQKKDTLEHSICNYLGKKATTTILG
jgi:energy-coupling factor transporter ATP-binding protein EcfA2